ncbi:MAG: NTP transferase domain-containing protein [Spirochaetes bacterium]|nr:NTP transferase domain-containing protein [Spirochaetota bacterium]
MMKLSVKALVLAAGKGVRMKSELPKVLHMFAGKPLVLHVVNNLSAAGIDDITVVVGYRGEMVEEVVRPYARVVWQHQQLGTGHAVMQTKSIFQDFSGGLIVACGDVPLMKPRTFRNIVKVGLNDVVKAVVVTMRIDNPFGYGRIVRDSDGNIERIVEEKDATEEIRKIDEVNAGTYFFDAKLLFEGLETIGTNNAQGEYYLPDVVQYIRSRGYVSKPYLLDDPLEGVGVNSQEDLKRIEAIARGV